MAQVATDGGGAPAEFGLDPPRNRGNDGTLPVARAGNPVGSRRGDAVAGGWYRDDDRRGNWRPVSQGAGARVPGGHPGLSRDPSASRPVSREPAPSARAAPRQARWPQT